MLFLRLARLVALLLRGQGRRGEAVLLRCPGGQVLLEPAQRGAVGRRAGGVGQDDDRRLQALGTVHGHDAHRIPGPFRLALHLGATLPQPVHEGLQGRRMRALVLERGIEELIHRVRRIGTEPRQHPRPARARVERTGAAQHGGEERMRRRVIRLRHQPRDPVRHPPQPCLRPAMDRERGPERPAPRMREAEQLLLPQPDQRRLQQRREGEVVLRQQQHIRQREKVLHRDLLRQHHAVHAAHRDAQVLQRAHQ